MTERIIVYEKLSRKELSGEELIDAMVTHPELVQRPIVVRGERAILARPAERVRELIEV